MILDYGGAWLVDVVLKRTLADVRPRESESKCQGALAHKLITYIYTVITRGFERRHARRAIEIKEAAKAQAEKKTA